MTDTSKVAPPGMYLYVGARSRPGSDATAEGTLRIRSDLRGPNGLLASPVAVFFHDLSGIAVVPSAPLVVPIQANVRVRSSAGEAEELIGHCEPTRRGRSIIDAIGATPRSDGRGFDLGEVAGPHRETAALGGPASGTLHVGEVLAVTDDVVDCRVEVREEGGSGRLAAASIARFRVLG